jgi:hypothetical protein
VAAACKDSADATRTLETVSDFWHMCLCAVSALSWLGFPLPRPATKPLRVSNGYDGGILEGKGNLYSTPPGRKLSNWCCSFSM